MNDTWMLVFAGLAGVALGALFFGGLWWSVRKAMASARPAAWVFASGLLRFGAALTGFYAVSGGDWRRLLACLVGFLAARLLVTRMTRGAVVRSSAPTQEARHAS